MLSIMFGNRRHYFDHAASTPASAGALRAFAHASALPGNPSSPHKEGREAKQILEDSRTAIARLMSVKADDIIFTSGASEANALAIAGHVTALKKNGRATMHILYLPSAHASVVKNVKALAESGVEIEELKIKDGEVDILALKGQIRPHTALVTMDYVCGETGTIWNTREVAQTLRDARSMGEERILLHADASQAPRTELIERTRIGADFLTLDAQKIGGVRGAGLLIAPRTIPLSSLMEGGGQERTLRPGTENVAAIAAFASALEEVQSMYEARRDRDESMRTLLLTQIAQSIPDALVNRGKKGVPHIVNLSLVGRDTDYLAALLDEAGFAVSTKSACESDSEEGSRAVYALTGEKDRALSTLRISWGRDVTKRDLMRLDAVLASKVQFLDSGK